MRYLLIALLLAGTAAAADPTRDLAALEQRMTAALARSDAAAIEALWADDLVWVGLNGKLATKAEQLEGMKAQAPTPAPNALYATNTDVKVHLYGQTAVVIVHSTWTTRTADGERASDYVATHVWNERRGQWRLVAAHISRVAQ
jgi:uncharacterized protein (TIGR02246 family)